MSVSPSDVLSCEVYSSFESVEGLREEWDSLVVDTESTFFMSFDWCRIWWRHYGKDRELCVFAFREDGRLVGLIPMAFKSVRLGMITLRSAKVVGADYMGLCALPMRVGHEPEMLQRVIDYCLWAARCDRLVFGPTPECRGDVEAIQVIRGSPSQTFTVSAPRRLWVNTYYRVLDSLDRYVATLAKKEREHYRRQMKRLEKEHTVLYYAVPPEDAEREFEAFVAMHEQRWHGVNRLGHFGDWPGSLEFHRTLVRDQASKGRLRLFCLVVDGEPVFYRYVYSFGECYYSLLPARLTDGRWRGYSLGLLGHILTVAKAVQESVANIDAGRGYYEFKVRRAGDIVPICCVEVTANRLGTRAKSCVFRAFAWALNLAYYRVWFLRLAPRLPLRRRPLWRSWIESRL